jgi:predicted phosphodiesterase
MVGLIGAWLGLLLAGRLRFTLGAFEVELFGRPGAGITEIALPPLGRIEADTHAGPLRMTATLERVDAELASEVIQDRGFGPLVREVETRGLAALRNYALLALAIGAGGAVATALLVYRRRWRKMAQSAAAGTLLLVAVTGLAFTTYRPSAFLEPTYTGSLRLASDLLGPVRQATDRIEDFRAELARLVRGSLQAYGAVAAPGPSEDAVTVLHISDVHASPLGMDFAQRLAESFSVETVVDTGDITSFGTPLEQSILSRIPGFKVPYVFVRGNHDTIEVATRIENLENGEVLENESVTIEGVTIHGAAHPLFTPDPEFDLSADEIADAVAEAGEPLAERLAGLPEPPDILAVHDDRMAEPSAGLVPLVIAGHFHRFGADQHDGTLFLQTASAGGGGLETFTAEESVPLAAEVLYLEGTPPRLVAVDRVTLDPEDRQLVVDRLLASSIGEPLPMPTPSPV